MLRETVSIHPDSFVCGLYIRGLKGRLPDNQCVDYDTKGPYVYFIRVAAFSFKNLGRDVIRCAANCSLLLAVEVKLGSQSEVSQLNFHLVIQEQVAKFEVSVDDSMRVEVL